MDLANGQYERYVLAGILEDPSLLSTVQLTAGCFSDQRNQQIFQRILELEGRGEEISLFSLCLSFDDENLELWAKEIADIVATPSRTEKAAEKLKEMATRRELIRAANEIVARAKEEEDIEYLCGQAEEAVLGATGTTMTTVDYVDMYELSVEYDEYQREKAAADGVVGIATGYERLDRITAGIQDGDLIYLGARPSMGKTTFAVNIALNAARKGKKVLFFSVEMKKIKIMEKIVANLGRINNQELLRGIDLGNVDLDQKYARALSEANMRPILINDRAGISVPEIASVARRAERKEGVDLIIIDYLQKLYVERKPGMNDVSMAKELSLGLANLAKNMDVPIFCLSQLSRSCESRNDKRPIASDLRESGDLEQDADCIWFLYRHGHYHPHSAEEKGIAPLTELILNKNRMGPKGTVLFYYDMPMDTFREANIGEYARYQQYA